MRIKKMYQGTVPKNKILDTYSTSATDTYSCNYVNNNFDRKGNMLKIFEGSTAPSSSNVINTTWQALGKFNLMIIELYKSNTNSRSTIIIPYFMLSTGSYLNESFRTTNVYGHTWLDGTTQIHIIPSADTIGNNYIKFDSYDSNIVIAAIYIIY